MSMDGSRPGLRLRVCYQILYLYSSQGIKFVPVKSQEVRSTVLRVIGNKRTLPLPSSLTVINKM